MTELLIITIVEGIWNIIATAIIPIWILSFFPLLKFLKRIGLSRLWFFTALIPVYNILFFCILAFCNWPKDKKLYFNKSDGPITRVLSELIVVFAYIFKKTEKNTKELKSKLKKTYEKSMKNKE